MRSLTKRQWLVAAVTTQLVLAVGIVGFGFHSPPAGAKVLGVSTAKDADKAQAKNEDKKDIVARGAVDGLYPGAAVALPVALANPNNFDVVVTALSVGVAGASAACPAAHLVVDDFTGRRLVPKNGTAVQPLVIRMSNDAPDACKQVEWQLTYSGRAVKDKA